MPSNIVPLISLYRPPSARIPERFCSSSISRRISVLLVDRFSVMVCHWLTPSIGPRSVVLPPAAAYRVGSKSVMWISSLLMVPGCLKRGLYMIAVPLTPPSYRVNFSCRNSLLFEYERFY